MRAAVFVRGVVAPYGITSTAAFAAISGSIGNRRPVDRQFFRDLFQLIAAAVLPIGGQVMAGGRSCSTRILRAGAVLAAVTLASTLGGTQAALAQATGYYSVDLATARSRASSTEWLRRLEAARQAQPGFAVETLDDFIKMNEYYDKFVADGVAVYSFRTAHGDEIQCIDVATQQSVLAAGLDRASIPRRATVEPTQQTQAGQSQGAGPPLNQGLDGSLDDLGRKRACPEGSFPKLIFPKANLYRFKKFEDIFRKHSRARPDAISPAAAAPHEYAHGSNLSIDNKGLSALFNVWSPTIQASDEMSLAQLWVVRGSGSALQSVEVGWQVYPQLWGGNDARLFVYSTSDNYGSAGCYNLNCGRFVQTNNSIVLGGPLPSYSTAGGTQAEVGLFAFRDDGGTHDWWIYVNGTAVGYYPNSLYNSTGLADKNSRVDFGGELVNDQTGGVNTSTQMGSGAFPSAGFQYAAYIKKIQYVDMSFVYQNATGLSPSISFPYLWDMSAVTYSSDPNWLTYFYFGGPGNRNYTVSVSASPPAGGTVGGGGSYAAGATPTVTATPNSGYAFVNWTDGGNVVSTSTSYTLPQLVANHTLIANFVLQTSPAVMTTPTPGSTLAGPSVTFNWTAGVGVTDYFLAIGNSVGDNSFWYKDAGTSQSQTVTGLPTDGRTIYVRLFSKINGVNQWNDYTYTAATAAVMTSPTPGSVLPGATVTFNWSAGSSVTDYFLSIGNNPGAADHTWWYQDEGTGHSQTVTGLPTDGRTLYVRLYSQLNGTYVWNDYSYTAATTATTYTISVSASPAGGGSVGGGGTFAAGSLRTVTATANSGYRFVSWTDNGSVVSSSTSYAFTLNTNRTLVANFTPTSATTLSSNSNPAIYGAPVTFTATVTGGGATPTGTVLLAFGDGNSTTLTLTNGSANVNHIYAAVGSYGVTATYSGDGTHNSSADALTETISKGITTIFVSASPNPSAVGQNVMLSASINSIEGGGAAPTGTVTFSDNGTVIGSGTLSNGNAQTFYSSFTAGSHFIAAQYGGDTNYFSSGSSSTTLTVHPAPVLHMSPAGDMVSLGVLAGPFAPPSFQYQLSASNDSLNYSIAGLPAWLDASAHSGTVTTSPATITFTINSSANTLVVGTYNATISIANTTSGLGNQTLNATLEVHAGGGRSVHWTRY